MAESVNDFIAGYVSGVLGILCGSPLDVLKIRLQTHKVPDGAKTSILHSIRHMTETEGAKVMGRGVASPVVGLAALNSILFASYGTSLRALSSRPDTPPSLGHVMISGSIAGFACCMVSTPTELVKVRAQVAGAQSTQIKTWDIAKTIFRELGIRGFYRGNAITMVRDIPGYGVYFGAYECLKRHWGIGKGDGEESMSFLAATKYISAGGFAGMLSWLAIYPIDVVKTHVQTDALNGGSLHACRQLYREYGARAFTRGFGTTMLRAFPVNAVTFCAYEWIIHLLPLPHGDYLGSSI